MLIDDWREILRHAWSVRLIALAAILSAVEVALPLVQGMLELPTGLFAALSGLSTAGAFVARFLTQKKLKELRDEQA